MSVEKRLVTPDESGLRLDRWFKRHFPDLGHGRLAKLLRTGQIRIDGARAEAGQRIETGQTIRVPPIAPAPPRTGPAPKTSRDDARQAADLQARVLHIDESAIILDKPAGLAVQGGSGTATHVDGLLDALRFGSAERPRLVHRLDKDTSGVLVLARTARAAQALAESFRHRDSRKLYWAAVIGAPKRDRGEIALKIGKLPGKAGERMVVTEDGQAALTRYAVLDQAGRRAAFVALWPVTGRTHQLRVHCAAIGIPILGDGKYGGREAFLPAEGVAKRLHLHARSISLPHPDGGLLAATAPLPDHMAATWAVLGFGEPAGDPFADSG